MIRVGPTGWYSNDDGPGAGGATSVPMCLDTPSRAVTSSAINTLLARYCDGPGRCMWSGAIWMPDDARIVGQSHNVRFGWSAATICRAWFHAAWSLGSSVVWSAHHTSWSGPTVSTNPLMSLTAQSTLPLQARMSLGPMLATMTAGSKPWARWLVSHSDMLAP